MTELHASGSPPCSPQMPSLMPGRVLCPFGGNLMSWRPLWSMVATDFLDDFLFLIRSETSRNRRGHAEAGLRQVIGAEAEECAVCAIFIA